MEDIVHRTTYKKAAKHSRKLDNLIRLMKIMIFLLENAIKQVEITDDVFKNIYVVKTRSMDLYRICPNIHSSNTLKTCLYFRRKTYYRLLENTLRWFVETKQRAEQNISGKSTISQLRRTDLFFRIPLYFVKNFEYQFNHRYRFINLLEEKT